MRLSCILSFGVRLLGCHHCFPARGAVWFFGSGLLVISSGVPLTDYQDFRLAGEQDRKLSHGTLRRLGKRQAVLDSPPNSPSRNRIRTLDSRSPSPHERTAEAPSQHHERTTRLQLHHYAELDRLHAVQRLAQMPLDVRRTVMRPVIAAKILRRAWAVHGRGVVLGRLCDAKQAFLTRLAREHPSTAWLLAQVRAAHPYVRPHRTRAPVDALIDLASPTEAEVAAFFPEHRDARPVVHALWQVEARRRYPDPVGSARRHFEAEAQTHVRAIDRDPYAGLRHAVGAWHGSRSPHLRGDRVTVDFPITSPQRLAVLAALTYGQELYPVTAARAHPGRTFCYEDEFRQRLDVPAFVREGGPSERDARPHGGASSPSQGLPRARSASPPARRRRIAGP